MSGVEIGGLNECSAANISELLLSNREHALNAATERADRVILGFRRHKVFERTFAQRLSSLNTAARFTQVDEGGFVPEGYYDPYTSL